MSAETRKQDGIMFQKTFQLSFPLTQQLSLDLNVPEGFLNEWRIPHTIPLTFPIVDFTVTRS